MDIYILWAIGGFAFLFIELMTPSMFFLNLAAGAFFASIFAYFYPNLYWLHILIFTLISIMCLMFLRPLMLKKQGKGENFETAYLNKEAKVVKKIEGINGKIKIYDEVWPARSSNNEEIEEGSIVKIVDTKDMIMYVEKI